MSADSAPEVARLSKKAYEKELKRLQVELVNLQRWVLASGARVVIVFEGRDAAGKGGAIKRIMQYLNPRSARVVALPTPNERERGQWYFQRYVERLPTKGEIVLFDRSWYNRAGVEHVLGYCTPEEYELFLRQVPTFERMLVDDGIILLKYWFSVSDDEQQRRFKSRLKDPMRRWKLSETDLESIRKWEAYSRAKDDMFKVTDLPEAPWWTVESDHKKSARINVIRHLLTQIPYKKIPHKKVALPDRPSADGYDRPGRELYKHVPDHAAGLDKPQPEKAAK
jgi:polyphosphate kinase 2